MQYINTDKVKKDELIGKNKKIIQRIIKFILFSSNLLKNFNQ